MRNPILHANRVSDICIRIAAVVCLCSGCTSVKVAMPPTGVAMTRVEAVKRVNSALNWGKEFQRWSSQNPNVNFRDMGAYDNYVGVWKVISSHRTPAFGGYVTRTVAELVKVRYAEIKDVIVMTEWLGLMCCGFIDPTAESYVVIVTHDGVRYPLPYGHSFGFFPLYLVCASSQNAQKAAEALCWLRDASASHSLY